MKSRFWGPGIARSSGSSSSPSKNVGAPSFAFFLAKGGIARTQSDSHHTTKEWGAPGPSLLGTGDSTPPDGLADPNGSKLTTIAGRNAV